MNTHRTLKTAMIFVAALVSAGALAEVGASDETKTAEAYVPGLGELMAATQSRHAKLWLAGTNRNWELADYEIDEIREGLLDAAKLNPLFKEIPVGAMINQFATEPLTKVEAAIKAKDGKAFRTAYDQLTNACNACHQAAGHGFIAIKRPVGPSFSNQRFSTSQR